MITRPSVIVDEIITTLYAVETGAEVSLKAMTFPSLPAPSPHGPGKPVSEKSREPGFGGVRESGKISGLSSLNYVEKSRPIRGVL